MQINIGKGIILDVDTVRLGFPAELPPVAEHVVYLGLRNPLMDSHAGITTDEADYIEKSRAVAERKLEAMYNGIVRVAGTREGNPVQREANAIALDKTRKQYKSQGKKLATYAKEIRADAAKLAQNPAILALAKKRVDEAAALEIEV